MTASLSHTPIRQKSSKPDTESSGQQQGDSSSLSLQDPLALDDVAMSWGNNAAMGMAQEETSSLTPAPASEEESTETESGGLDLSLDGSEQDGLGASPLDQDTAPSFTPPASDDLDGGVPPVESKEEPTKVPDFSAAVAQESADKRETAASGPIDAASTELVPGQETSELETTGTTEPVLDEPGNAPLVAQAPVPVQGGGAPALQSAPVGLDTQALPIFAQAPTGPVSSTETSAMHIAQAMTQVESVRGTGMDLQAQVLQAVSTAKGEIQTEGEGQKAAVLSEVQGRVAELQGSVTASQGQIETESQAMADSITGAAAQARQDVGAARDQEIQRLLSEVEGQKTRFGQESQKLAAGARSEGKALADKATSRAAEQASQAQKKAGAKIRTFSSKDDPDKLQAMTQAVNTVASDAAQQASDAGGEIAKMALEESEKLATEIETRATELANGLSDNCPQVQAEIEKLATTALSQIDTLETSALSGLESGRVAAVSKLDEILTAGVARYEEMGTATIDMIDQSVVQSQLSLDQVAVDFTAQVEATVTGFESTISTMPDPEPASVAGAAAQVCAQLQGSAVAVMTGVSQSSMGVRASMVEGAQSLLLDLGSSQETANGTVQAAGDQLVAELWASTNQATEGLGKMGADVQQGAAGLVNDSVSAISGGVDKALAELASKKTEGMSALSGKVTEGLAETDSKLSELPGKMDQAASDVASQYDGPWYKRLGSALLGALKAIAIVVAVLVVAAVIGIILIALGVSAAVLATIAAVLVVASLILVAAVGIYSRWQEYRAVTGTNPDFWTGLGIVAVGILDVTGIPSMVEGIAGERAFSGKELTDFERGETFTNGLLSLISTILLVREFTVARDVVKVVNAGDDIAKLTSTGDDIAKLTGGGDDIAKLTGAGDDVSKLTGTGDDITKLTGTGDDITKLTGTGDDIAKVSGGADDISKLSSRWNDPKLTPDELWQLYKGSTKKPSLNLAEVESKFAAGWRFNPATKRWAKPFGPTGPTTVADDAAKLVTPADDIAGTGDDLAKVGDDIAGVSDDAARMADDIAALKGTVNDVVDLAKTELPAIEKVVAGNSEAASEVSALRKLLDQVADSVKFTSDLKKAEVKSVMDLCAKSLKKVERVQKLIGDEKAWADAVKSITKIGDKVYGLYKLVVKVDKAYADQGKGDKLTTP